MTAYLGMILPVAFNYAPRGWNLCAGQILPINQYQAIFALLGTYFGGNGTTNFALPDLRGRAPIGCGTGQGLAPCEMGQQGGTPTATLLPANLPPHNHMVRCASTATIADAPGGFPAVASNPQGGAVTLEISDSTQATGVLNAAAIANAGSSVPVNLMPPYLAVNYIICMSGIFPSRN